MKILVIGSMHGNEPLGPKLVASLKKMPIAGVDTLIANPRALQLNRRFAVQDLNRSFPGSDNAEIYEQKRAAEIMKICQSYDLVLDFHNTLCADNDCAFVGASADSLLFRVASYLNLNRVIIADYDCINKYVPQCISIEISVTSPRMKLNEWRTVLQALSTTQELPAAPATMTLYRYVRTVMNEERDALGLQERDLPVFKPIPDTIATKLGVVSPAYPIFIGKNYTEGVFAGILQKIN